MEAELCPGIASCVTTKLSDELRKATIKAWGELIVLGDGGSTAKRSRVGTFVKNLTLLSWETLQDVSGVPVGWLILLTHDIEEATFFCI